MSKDQEKNSPSADISVCRRLKEVREQKGLSQADVAMAARVSPKTAWRWEKEIPIPSDKLATLIPLGIDVTYVLTGARRSVYEVIRDDIAKAKKEMGLDFVAEEPQHEYDLRTKSFADNFSALDESGKEAVEAMIKALSKKTGKEDQ